MSFLVLGDPHLGGSLSQGKQITGSGVNSRVIDQSNLLDWVLNTSIEKHVFNIFVTGDIFEDPKPSNYLIVLFLNWLKACRAHGINVHLIHGNHDVLRTGHVYSSPLDIIEEAELENVYVYKQIQTIYFGTKNLAITIVPFRDRKSLGELSNSSATDTILNQIDYELAEIPPDYTKIMIGHLAIEGSIFVGNEINDIGNELFLPLDFLKKYDYVWMGHVHKPQIKNKFPHIAHIGSMDISDFGEVDHKKHVVVFDTDNMSFSHIDLPTRKLEKIIINVPKEVDDTTSYVLNELSKNKFDTSIISLEVNSENSENKSINKSEIEKVLLKNGAFSVSSILESKKTNIIKKDKAQIDTKVDVKSAIKLFSDNFVDKEMQSEFLELTEEIIEKYKSEI